MNMADTYSDSHQNPIESLGLNIRAYACLKRGGIDTVQQLLNLSYAQLMTIRNFGQQSYQDTKHRLIIMDIMDADHLLGPFAPD
jgi:DNA-directed RNA polymerase alpha subunit